MPNIVYQTSDNDCGLAVLAMMLQHYGRQVSLYELKMCHPIGSAGMSAFDLREIARGHGLDTRVFAFKGDSAQIGQVPTPFIAHWGGQHFTVVTAIDRGRMRLLDPRDGHVEVPLDDALSKWPGVAIYMTPRADFEPTRRGGVLRSWLPELRHSAGMLGGLMALSALLLGLAYVVPFTIARTIGEFIEYGTLPFAPAGLALLCVGFLAAFFLFNWAKQTLLLHIRLRLERRLSERFTGGLFRLPFLFFSRVPFGDLLDRLSSVGAVREFVSARLAAALVDGALVIALVTMVFVTSHKLGIVYLGLVAMVAHTVYLHWPRLRERFRDEVLAYTATFDTFADSLMGIHDIKANRTESVFYGRWRERFLQYLDASRRRGRLSVRLEALLAVLGGGVPLVVLLASLALVHRAELPAGDAILAYLLIQYSMAPLLGLLGTGMQLQQLVIHTDRIDGLGRFVQEQGDSESADADRAAVTRIELRKVGFAYVPGGREVLSDVDIEIGDGRLILVTGVSGSGKSTLLKLLTSTLRPSRGEVRYFSGAQEIDHRRAAPITSIIQDAAMFRGTVLENIAMFDPHADFDAVVEAARIACIHDEIMALPMGYSTAVERGGANLSGGQRQRIALARAVLKRPPILVLDEFTSHLDAGNEQRIITNLRRLGCTVVVATHRHEWATDDDTTVHVDGGRLCVSPSKISLLEARSA